MHRHLPVLLLAAAAALSRIPFASQYLYSWDAVQFALALERFDIAHHQPHPPGYALYILLGKGLAALTGDANGAFVALSIAATVAVVLLFHRLILTLGADRRPAILLTAAFAFLPSFWFFGEVASTYPFDALFSTAFGLCATLILTHRRPGSWVLFSVLLGVSGGFRQSLIPLFLPLWLLAGAFLVVERKVGVRAVGVSAAVGAASVLCWFVPLLIISGGWTQYWNVTNEQLGAAAAGTSLFRGAPVGTVVSNAKNIVKMTVASVHVLPAVLVLSVLMRRGGLRLSRRAWWLAAGACAWLAPSFFVYLFVHLGNVGYLMTVVPALVLLCCWPAVSLYRTGGRGRTAAVTVLAAAVVVGVLIFTAPTPLVPEVLARKNYWYTYFTWRYIETNDALLHGLITTISGDDLERTAVVAQKDFPGDAFEYFRHLGYYLPSTDVYEIFYGTARYFRVRNHAPQQLIRSATIIVPRMTERIYLVADVADPAVAADAAVTRVRTDLPLYVVDMRGMETWSYAGYTFQKSE